MCRAGALRMPLGGCAWALTVQFYFLPFRLLHSITVAARRIVDLLDATGFSPRQGLCKLISTRTSGWAPRRDDRRTVTASRIWRAGKGTVVCRSFRKAGRASPTKLSACLDRWLPLLHFPSPAFAPLKWKKWRALWKELVPLFFTRKQ